MRSSLIIGMLLAGAAAATTAAVVVRRGPARASRASIAEWIAAAAINRDPALAKEPLKGVEVRVADDEVQLRLDDEGKRVAVCRREGREGTLSATLGAVLRGQRHSCAVHRGLASDDLRFFDVAGRVRYVCPAQYTGITEEQLHGALFLPALASEAAGRRRRSVLEAGRLLEGCAHNQSCECKPGEGNCLLTFAPPTLVYCGEVRPCRQGDPEGACFGGTREVRPVDVATSLYYYRALTMGQLPSQVGAADCGPRQTSLYQSSLVTEAVTRETIDEFASSRALDDPRFVTHSAAGADIYARMKSALTSNNRGICFVIQQIRADDAHGRAIIERSLGFPVFAPFDASDPRRASPLLHAMRASVDEPKRLESLFPTANCEGPAGFCDGLRNRIGIQLKAALGGLQLPLQGLPASELALRIGGSGAFHVVDYDRDTSVRLESFDKPSQAGRPFAVHVESLWPEQLDKQAQACAGAKKSCLFRGIWNRSWAKDLRTQARRDRYSMVGLFGRAGSSRTACVRKLLAAVAGAGKQEVLALQNSLREKVTGEAISAVTAGCPWPKEVRRAAGLTPEPESSAGSCEVRSSFEAVERGRCETLDLAYVEEEPWAGSAQAIVQIAAAQQIPVRAIPIRAQQVAGSEGSWDVLLTAATNYFTPLYPTLLPLLDAAGSQNRSQGTAVNDQGAALLAAYEAKVVSPPPPAFAQAIPPALASLDKAELLRKLEHGVANEGRAPILPLAFLDPSMATLNVAGDEIDAMAPDLLDRLLYDNREGRWSRR